MRKIISILIIIALVIGMSGCNLIKVDPERDMQQIIFKTKEGEVSKKEFVNYFTYYEMVYKLNNYEMPVDEDLEALKEDILNSMVEVNILKLETINKKYEVDTSDVEEEFDATIAALIEGFGDEAKYTAFIEERNLTREEFEGFLKKYHEDVKYVNVFIEEYSKELQESGVEANQTVVTVDEEELVKDEFYYRLSQMEFFYFANYGTGMPTDEESVKTIYSQIQDEMATAYLIRQDANKQKINIANEDIEKSKEDIKSQYVELVGEEQLSTYLDNYYLTDKRFDEIIGIDAQTRLYEDAIKENLEKDTTITEKEIQESYDANKASYNTSTVSAKHILTESEEFANEISKEITDAKSFEAAFEKYKDHEEVKEASDLGEFNYGDMVSDFADAALGLEKGEVSKPVQSEFGYHIIYVYEKENIDIPTLEEKEEEIKNTLMNQKVGTKLTEYKSDLISKGKIEKAEIKDPFGIFVEELKEDYNVKTYPKRLK
ncbi:peptidylprolyl isomerase [Alkalibaculum sporogenes]|nr:peptidylprolyl isomerase [Alkalibaculum sporogenes]